MTTRQRDGLLVAGIVFLAFAGSIFNGFTNWDDNLYVTENPLVREGSLESLRRIFFSFQLILYHPLTLFAYWVQYRLWGLQAWGYHLAGVGLHAANAVLVLALLRGLWPDKPRWCLWGALLFALHPLRVEAVSWVAGLKEPLFTFFFLAAMVTHRRRRERSEKGNDETGRNNGRSSEGEDRGGGICKRPCGSMDFATLGLGFLSLLAKPTAVTLPVILLLDDLLLGKRTVRRSLLPLIPLFLLAALFAVLAVLARHGGGELHLARALDPLHGVLLASASTCFSLLQTVWPFGLSAYYPGPAERLALAATTLLPVGLLTAATLAALVAARRIPEVAFGWFFWLITLAPSSGLIPVGAFFAADRFTYLPGVGLTIALTAGAIRIATRMRNNVAPWVREKAGPLLAVAVLVFLAALCFQRQTVWYDSITLWSDAATVYPRSEIIQENLAEALLAGGNFEAAEQLARRVVEQNPTRVRAMLLQGSALALGDRLEDASAVFKRAAETPTPLADQQNEALYRLARVEYALGRRKEAIAHLHSALAFDPHNEHLTSLLSEWTTSAPDAGTPVRSPSSPSSSSHE